MKAICEYTEPHEDEPCTQCKWRNYDSWHNEMWCSHNPPPYNIGYRLIIDKWGHCDYWEKY